MKYKLLENNGVLVSELSLGTMTFEQYWNSFLKNASKEKFKKIFDLFVKADRNFIDIANDFQNETSKKYVGEVTIVLETKFVLLTNDNRRSRLGQQP